MTADMVPVAGGQLALFRIPRDSPGAGVELVGAHGWGQTHRALLPLAQALRHRADAVLLDLPGFGAAPPPPSAWSTADYADAVAEWLRISRSPASISSPSPARGGVLGWGSGQGAPHYPNSPPLAGERKIEAAAPVRRIWVAHSFGCRVGLQLAGRHPEALSGLFLVAAPGLPPQRSLPARTRLLARRWAFRLARQLVSEGPARERLRDRFGSADYREASPLMRQVLVKAVNEDLSAPARAIRVPVVLIYGDQDRDTPPDIGMRLERLIPNARLVILRGFGHLDILTDGHHQLVQRLGEFLEQVA
ncbi:MAG: alpha/beta fold hydrolase [Thiohalocapsa sp.]